MRGDPPRAIHMVAPELICTAVTAVSRHTALEALHPSIVLVGTDPLPPQGRPRVELRSEESRPKVG